ncbi:unnamed protein product [Pieris macdunnoughi]|uniref:Ig-like domain-containing protein n=1 Tax=Pieris macdunnoughi TaxID=345717 RepID=A0A821XZZ9_9NEOP|nr:unnamed protein product [Pieris macdunnoughi]
MNEKHSRFTVSWIRHRDLHILTVGGYTYTSDQRFQASHSPHTDDWTLQIKWAQQRDAGVYECQVSTQPVRSFFVTLHVVDCDEIYQRMFSDAGVCVFVCYCATIVCAISY